jgi:glycosyltransferase involved in cell wall biosynthesis
MNANVRSQLTGHRGDGPGGTLRSASHELQVAFVMEQHLGHSTFSTNLRRALAGEPGMVQHWTEVRYAPSGGLWERLPVRDEVRGLLRGRREVRHDWAAVDVTLFNTQVPAVIGGRRVRRQPYVLAIDITPKQYDQLAYLYGHDADQPGLRRWAKHRLNRSVMQRASACLPWSSWVGRSLIDDYDVDPSRVTVIPPGVDTGRWKPGPHRDRAGPLQVLFVGGDFQRKGGPELLDAFRSLPNGAATLVVVTKEHISPVAGVSVLTDLEPNSDRLLRLYQDSDIFALPSRAEAFGIAAVEASATGLPVLATETGGLADIVDDGTTGVLVPPGDVSSLTAALRRLVLFPELRQRYGAAGRRKAERDFDAQVNSHRIASVLRQASER